MAQVRRGLGRATAAVAVVAAVHAGPVPASSPGGGARDALPATEAVAIPAAHLPEALHAHWARAAGAGRRPAVLLLHGCGGLYRNDGAFSARHAEMRDLVRAQGWHALLPDSFATRGMRQICTIRIGERTVTAQDRKRDALAALRWLAAHPEVDPARIALIGWSHGGSTTLNAVNARDAEVLAAPHPAIATAFYPGCTAPLRGGWQPATPTAIYIGALDDWTPATPCVELGRANPGLEVLVYPGAHHGFDDPLNPVRLRTDVPNGVRPGAGVTVGADPASRVAAHQHLMARMRAALN